jgi:hypothetical protein
MEKFSTLIHLVLILCKLSFTAAGLKRLFYLIWHWNLITFSCGISLTSAGVTS